MYKGSESGANKQMYTANRGLCAVQGYDSLFYGVVRGRLLLIGSLEMIPLAFYAI